MSIGRSARKYWFVQAKMRSNPSRAEIHNFAKNTFQLRRVHFSGFMQININRKWLRNTNRVRKLNCAFISKVCCDNIFSKIARSISRRTVNLCRVFAGERATAMRGSTTIGIYDYLTTSKTGIPIRPANDKRARWVDVKFIFRAHPAGWQNSFDKWANKFTDITL